MMRLVVWGLSRATSWSSSLWFHICKRDTTGIFEETSGHFSRCFVVATNTRYFIHEVWTSPSVFVAANTVSLGQNLFLIESFLCLNFTRGKPSSQSQDKNQKVNLKIFLTNLWFVEAYIANILSGALVGWIVFGLRLYKVTSASIQYMQYQSNLVTVTLFLCSYVKSFF